MREAETWQHVGKVRIPEESPEEVTGEGYPSIVEMLVPLNYHHSQPQPWSEAGLSLGDKLCACDARAGEVELFWAFWSPGDPERVPDFKC